ncbi:MAG: lysophospholipid acyltransferase family protein [Candidatus Hodarchaeota archaeon]
MGLIPPKTTPRSWSLLHKSFYQLVKLILPRFMRVYFRFEANGLENTKNLPEGTPVIYCFNHRSHLDTFIFASALVHPFGNRTTCGLMADGKAMEQKFFSLLKYVGAFPVYSQNPAPALDYAAKLLNENMAVLIAPQGKRIYSNPLYDYHNLIRQVKSGVGRLILRFNGKIPVVPMYIHGSHEALNKGRIVPKFKAFISVSFSKPLFFTKYKRREGWNDSDPNFYSVASEISKQIMMAIRDQMLIQEKHFFTIIRKKLKIPLERLEISPDSHLRTNRFLAKLLHYSPKELKNWLDQSF